MWRPVKTLKTHDCRIKFFAPLKVFQFKISYIFQLYKIHFVKAAANPAGFVNSFTSENEHNGSWRLKY
jgi:hypothetical protein